MTLAEGRCRTPRAPCTGVFTASPVAGRLTQTPRRAHRARPRPSTVAGPAVTTHGRQPVEIWPGTPYPLGATYDGSGVNFALFSEVAERVELCLVDDDGAETRLDLPEVDGFVWHAYVPGLQPGQRYGFRVHGPYDPEPGPPLRPEQAAARPLRQGDRGPGHQRPVPVLLRLQEPEEAQHRRQPRQDDALGRHQPVLRLGPRPPAAPRVPRDGHLRGARQGPDDDPPRRARGDPRHVCRRSRTRRSSTTSRTSASPPSS